MRRAGVSSFGIGGTNAHVVLEEAPEVEANEVRARGAELLVLSGKSEAALSAQVERYRTHLVDHSEQSLEDVCYTAGAGRSHFDHRLSIVAGTRAELSERLDQLANGELVAGINRGEVAEGGKGKLAFMFTGQGAQYAGMAQELYEREPVFRAVLDRCAACLQAVLERPLLEVMFESPAGALDETGYTQPALYALETGLAALWASWGIEPDVVMGHSVGEYAAAQVAGVFELEDGARLIAARARLMQALPGGGAMVAVLAPLVQVQSSLSKFASQVSVAALNGPENVVLSGEADAIEQLCGEFERDGVMCRRLQVSHAFHSALMEPMLSAYREEAQRVEFQTPRLMVISNVTGEVAGERMASADYWVEHVRSPVRFAEGVVCAAGEGVSCYVELGPKPTLLGMARSSVDEGQWLASLRPGQSDVAVMLESLGALYVRGHAPDWPGVYAGRGYRKVVLPTYPFQRQRYWVKNTQSAPPLAAKNNQLADWLYTIDWLSKVRASSVNAGPTPGYWLVLADPNGLSDSLARLLSEQGHECVTIAAADSYCYPQRLQCSINPASAEDFNRLLVETGERLTTPLLGIIDLCPADLPGESEAIEDPQKQDVPSSCHRLLNLVQALVQVQQVPQYGIWIVTRTALAVNDDRGLPGIAHAGLWGMGRTIALEHAELWGGMIDLDSAAGDGEAQHILTDILDPQAETQIAYRGDMRLVPRLVRKTSGRQQAFKAKADASYLITGGLGGLGLCIAGWLADCGARHLVLLARSEPGKDARTLITQLKDRGIEVIVAPADVTDREALASVLLDISESDYPLRGIMHAAGQLRDATLQELDWPQFECVLAPKVTGALNLHELTTAVPLDFFVMFSSAAAVFGSPGQANYAAANTFLDALAHHRRGHGLPALSINWGPWEQVGMAARMDRRDSGRLSLNGIGTIDPSSGLELLAQLITEQPGDGSSAQTVVMPMRWEELSQRATSVSPLSAFLEQLLVTDHTQSSSLVDLDNLQDRTVEEKTEYILQYLKALAAGIFQSEIKALSDNPDLLAMGADSLMIMEILDSIKRDLQLMVYPREIYANPKLATLAKYLAEELAGTGASSSDVQGELTAQNNATVLQTMAISGVGEGLPQDFKRLPAVVFLLSSPRAGSTLLRTILAGHPQLFSPPELHLLPFATMGQRHAHLKEAYLDEGLQRALMELKSIEAAQARSIVDNWVSEDVPVCEVYGALQALCAPRILVDKSPSYAFDRRILERAESLFEHARYIHLVRHPISVIESFVRMRPGPLQQRDD
ncbi:MAG: SDR family NAD(P)-dependent oxidoreductase, partial [Thermotogales bacterium]|nr:SDR family NAD(P)-dependent oxidoreductase [Thermotogales bacterium]